MMRNDQYGEAMTATAQPEPQPVADVTAPATVAPTPPVAKPRRARKPNPNSRSARWTAAASQAIAGLEALVEIQDEYEEWQSNLPENLQGSALGEKLDTVVNIDLDSALEAAQEADGANLPLGFGRD